MDLFIIIALIVAGIILFIVEVMIIPGISLAGIMSVVCLVSANFYAFYQLGTTAGFITLAISILLSVAAIWWVVRSKTIERLALKKDIDSTVSAPVRAQVKVGDTGTAATRLALIGNALFDGHLVEVKSCDGFLDEKTPVVVERIDEGVIMVRRSEKKEN